MSLKPPTVDLGVDQVTLAAPDLLSAFGWITDRLSDQFGGMAKARIDFAALGLCWPAAGAGARLGGELVGDDLVAYGEEVFRELRARYPGLAPVKLHRAGQDAAGFLFRLAGDDVDEVAAEDAAADFSGSGGASPS